MKFFLNWENLFINKDVLQFHGDALEAVYCQRVPHSVKIIAKNVSLS